MGLRICEQLDDCKFIIVNERNRDGDKPGGMTDEILYKMAYARSKGNMIKRELYANVTFEKLYDLKCRQGLSEMQKSNIEKNIFENALIWGYVHLTKSLVCKVFRLRLEKATTT